MGRSGIRTHNSFTRSFRRGLPLLRGVLLGTVFLGVVSVHAVTVFSRSGQFVVHSVRATPATLAQYLERTNQTRVALGPDLLAVSCERIKTGVLRELDLADRWQGKIELRIQPRQPYGTTPTIVSTRYADAWRYTIELPEVVEPPDLVRAVVQVLLTELANRSPGTHPAELPLWLVEGLSARLLRSIGPELVVRPNPLLGKLSNAAAQLQSTSREHIGAPDLQEVRAWLLDRTPLTFQELSLPAPEQLRGEAQTTYRRCSELLFGELQKLPRGRGCLAAMISLLPQSLNWQTAFLRAFEAHFGRLLDVEKWWSVTTRYVLLGSQPHSWSPQISLGKLAELLQIRVEIRPSPNAPPRTTFVSVQEFMVRAEPAVQRSLIQWRVDQLQVLKVNAAREVAPLVENYATVLQDYLKQRGRSGYSAPAKRQTPGPPALLLREVSRRLEELDRQRARLQNAAGAAAR